MTLLQSIILGIVQGLTEFIPVSSSGHLVLIPEIFGWEEQSQAFDIIVHGGSLLALLIYFGKDLVSYFKNKRLVVNVLIASIPALLIGYFFQDFINEELKEVWIVAINMIVVGILIIILDKVYEKNKLGIDDLKPKNALVVGASQVLALIRGVSRSGITMLAGLTQGLTRKDAAKFAFLMAIPVIGTATGYEVLKMLTGTTSQEPTLNLMAGFIASFASSLIAIKFMLKFLENNKLAIFGIYRIILGIILLLLIIF